MVPPLPEESSRAQLDVAGPQFGAANFQFGDFNSHWPDQIIDQLAQPVVGFYALLADCLRSARAE
jgi:hypothetical protein